MPLKDWMAKNDALATTPATNLESTDLRPGQAHPEARVGSKLVNRGELHTRRQPTSEANRPPRSRASIVVLTW
jgi:hypothetical protein